MLLHVLNGDALNSQLPNEIHPRIIMRECMIEGPLDYDDLDEFWSQRCAYFVDTFHTTKDDYEEQVITELGKLKNSNVFSEVCMCFEFDLFCQTNMWFIISFIKNKNVRLTWVKPDHNEWSGFGSMSKHRLSDAFENRIELSPTEIEMYLSFWNHYVRRDMPFFASLEYPEKGNLNCIRESVNALVDLYPKSGEGRPTKLLKSINSQKPQADFGTIFRTFSEEAGVYGYGDLQVKHILEKII